MTKIEIASYLGAANIALASTEENDPMFLQMRKALLEAQLIISKAAIDEIINEGKKVCDD